MKVSFQALSRHLDLAGVTAERVAEVLPMLGLEVESVTTFGLAPLPLVVVGEIKSFEKHPKADRLSVCQVDAGEGSLRQIVCGAKNFKAGDRVPVALPGTMMPGGFEIKVSKLRDVDSAGMMCSSEELGLGKGEDGLLILTPRQPAVGTPLNSLFGAPDTVLEIAFDSIQPSPRHESGFALRFPRIARIRTDKTVREIDTLDTCRLLAGTGEVGPAQHPAGP